MTLYIVKKKRKKKRNKNKLLIEKRKAKRQTIIDYTKLQKNKFFFHFHQTVFKNYFYKRTECPLLLLISH